MRQLNKRNLARTVQNTAGDIFLGGLTTSLSAVILGLDLGTAVASRVPSGTSDQQSKTRVYVPDPGVQRRAVIVAAHGTTQHAGSFQKLAEHLTACGYVLVAVDLRGHGRHYHNSAGTQSEREVNYEKSVRDFIRTCKRVRADYPNLPLFCFGESVGASVASKAVASKPGLADGIVLCSTGARPYVLNPTLTVPDFVKGIFQLNEPLDVSRYIAKYSTEDDRVSEEMIGDPLSRVAMTPRELVRTAWFLATTPVSARKIDPSIPVLLIQGSIDNLVAKHGMQEIMKNLRSRKKELVVVPGAGHILMGTSFLKPALVEALLQWLDQHSPVPTPAKQAQTP